MRDMRDMRDRDADATDDIRSIFIDAASPASGGGGAKKQPDVRRRPRVSVEASAWTRSKKETFQDTLTEETFASYLDGFEPVDLADLPGLRGGRMRYVIETLGPDGEVASRKYRLGGVLTKVDPRLRYLRLFNPFARLSWSVQLQPADKRLRMYHMAPATGPEIALLRTLLKQLEAGEIVIKRVTPRA